MLKEDTARPELKPRGGVQKNSQMTRDSKVFFLIADASDLCLEHFPALLELLFGLILGLAQLRQASAESQWVS